MILIKNADIMTMDEVGEIKNGYLIIDGEKISAVGDMSELTSDIGAAEVIDAGGAVVTPGLVDAHSHIGMWEDGLDFEGSDGNEETEPITPHLRAIDAVNPMDRAFSEALAAGVTTVVTGPGSANPIGGQIIAMKTAGRCVDRMVLRAPLAIKAAFGENPKSVYNDKSQAPTTRMAIAAEIREALFKAREYKRQLDEFNANERDDAPEYDMKSEALLPLLSGEIQLHAHAHRADDIFTAIRIAREFDLKLVLVHATEGHIICDELKEAGVPVLAGPILTDRSKPELKNMRDDMPNILTAAGVKTALICDHPEIPQKHLMLCAAMLMRGGMSETDALRAVTSVPAEICGLEDRVGRLAAGLDADVVIWNGRPLDISSAPKTVICGGNVETRE